MSSSGALTPAPASVPVDSPAPVGDGPSSGGSPGAGGAPKNIRPAPEETLGGAVVPGRTVILRPDSALAVGMIIVVGVMLVPLPSAILDLALSLSVALSLTVFLFSLHIERPLEFSAFPSLLLLLTLFRLALNVASTRLILLHGNEGEGAAGRVIQAFGQFVIGGNTVVGIIVFLILVIINFVVITKGAGRIAEVAARFTLDAMPGKQMAIDADLGAGLISEEEARRRRNDISAEADFFGSMDGSSKFVRGDAIAGLVITAVNIIAGFVVGVMQQDMSAADAAAVYTSLSVGDGLVSQIPALLTSIAAGLVTTRASVGGALGERVRDQVFGARRPVAMAAGVLGILAAVPGMPHFAFGLLAAGLGYAAYRVGSDDAAPKEAEAVERTPELERQEIEEMLPVDLLEVEVGYELVPLVDAARDGSLLRRIGGIRKQLAEELGVLVPPIHLRDNLRLRPGGYRVLLSGNKVGEGEVRPHMLLAMNPGGDVTAVAGEDTVEPAFGMPARWVGQADRERAELAGYTVVDAASVVATHLGELLRSQAADLLGRREAQELIDLHGRHSSKVIEELIPNELSLGAVIAVLRGLLREGVSIRDFRNILEALADHAPKTKEPDDLIELVRRRLSKQLTATFLADDGALYGLVLAPEIEGTFRQMQNPGTSVALDPQAIKRLLSSFERAAAAMSQAYGAPLILCSADIRRSVATFVARHIPDAAVMSFRELDPAVDLRTVGVVGGDAGGLP